MRSRRGWSGSCRGGGEYIAQPGGRRSELTAKTSKLTCPPLPRRWKVGYNQGAPASADAMAKAAHAQHKAAKAAAKEAKRAAKAA